MVIQKVFGLNATSISMNDRFTMLTSADRVLARPVKRQLTGNFLANHFNYTNRNLIEQIARMLEQQVERLALRQRLGFRQGSLRRFSSENSLPGLRRSNSFGNLSQRSVQDRISWQQNGSLKRSASFGSLFGGSWQERPKRRSYRHGGQRALRGRFGARGRGGRQNNNRQKGQMNNVRGMNKQNPGRGRGGKRGGISKNENQTPIPTKEELDAQLDEYMASSKLVLDKELDTYMKNAMELE